MVTYEVQMLEAEIM